jgi:hypothetical protein
MALLRWFRAGLTGLKRALMGNVLFCLDTQIASGLGIVSLRLKRERSTGNEYVVLVGMASGSTQYYLFELEEFDRFIEAGKTIRISAQRHGAAGSPHVRPKLSDFTSMVLTGEVLQQIDTEISDGFCVVSLRLKRERGSGKEYVVLAGIASGNYQYYPFDLDEFDQLIHAAINVRAAAMSHNLVASPVPDGRT